MKRLFDLSISLIVTLVLLPLMLAVALVVGVSSRGGVLYRQKRVGRFGRDFVILKFRTMYRGSDQQGLLTIGGRDSRITPVGYWLRKYKLDELPQFLNVVWGSMSLVGPRPEVRQYVDLYTPEQRKVLNVRPGITDPASIHYIDENRLLEQASDPMKTYVEEIMPHKLAINLRYLETASCLNDLKVLAATIRAIVR